MRKAKYTHIIIPTLKPHRTVRLPAQKFAVTIFLFVSHNCNMPSPALSSADPEYLAARRTGKLIFILKTRAHSMTTIRQLLTSKFMPDSGFLRKKTAKKRA